MKITKSTFGAILLFVMVVLTPIIGLQLNKAPDPVSKDTPSSEFSAYRAIEHLEHIASKPHSIGTTEHEKVYQYIISQLHKLGIKPELQTKEVYLPDSYVATTVKNIIVKIPGQEPGKSVLMAGHYDSEQYAPGASDDGSAIVTMLETIRLLKTLPPFKNDIIFLFTDGEEIGSVGANTFIQEHPLAKEIGLVLNFESSGTSGPALMFETSQDNNWIISEFAKAVPMPMANSLSYEIYRHMPNSTDLTSFKNKGYKGFNFAYIENRYDYHSGGDNIENTSVSSIQHDGSYATSLIKHFANIDLNNSEKGNAVYFNTIGNGFIHYHEAWVMPLMILTCIVFIIILILGIRKKLINPSKLVVGFLSFIIQLIVTPAIVTLIYLILLKYYPEADLMLLFYNYRILLLGFVLIAIAIAFCFYNIATQGIKIWQLITFIVFIFVLLALSAQISLVAVVATLIISAIIYFLYRRPKNVWELSFGSFTGWVVLMAAISLTIPGASYLFTWPLLFSLIPAGVYFLRKEKVGHSIVDIILLWVFAIPALLWFSHLTFLILVALGINMIGFAILFTVFGLSLLIPHIHILTKVKPWTISLVAVFGGIVCILLGSTNLEYSERYKKQNSLVLATNGNSNETFFTSFDGAVDEWTINFLSEQPTKISLNDFNPQFTEQFNVNKTELDNLAVPSLKVLNETTLEGHKVIKFLLNSERNADHLGIQIKTNSKNLKAKINNSEWKELKHLVDSNCYYLNYLGLPDDGIEMELKLLNESKIEVILTDFVIGLDNQLLQRIKDRPNYMMSNGDASFAAKTFLISTDFQSSKQ